jgi:hypothetical protein
LKSVCSDFISKNENRKTFFGAVWFYYALHSFYFLSSCSVILRYFLFYLKRIKHYIVITLIQNQNLARRRMASSIEKIWWTSFSHPFPDIISLENWAYPRLKSFRRLCFQILFYISVSSISNVNYSNGLILNGHANDHAIVFFQ